jgi:hypothetical protein
VKPAWVAGAVAAAALVGAGGWYFAVRDDSAPAARVTRDLPETTLREEEAPASGSDVVAVQEVAAPVDAGSTPMAQRVAHLGLLNKRNGVSRDLQMKPGQAMRVGDTIVRLRACERTAPWEQQTLTGAFVQLDVQGTDRTWKRAFSGWLYKERPQLNVVLHPVYDVWVKSCTTSFPAAGPDTVTLAAPSSARKSPARGATPTEDDSESASASNAM